MIIPKQPTHEINHIVLSGGGIKGFIFFGILMQSCLDGFWDLKNIKSFYTTSSGSIFALFIILGFEWKIIENYLINLPLGKNFNFDLMSIFNSYENCGIFEKNVIYEIFLSLFKANDISLDITLLEFYEINKIDFHIFLTEMDEFNQVDVSHKTHPNWKLLDAVYCSSCLPILFKPFLCPFDNKTYIDGGFFCNYPIRECYEAVKDNYPINSIFGINLVIENSNEKSNLFEYVSTLIKKMIIKNNVLDSIEFPNEMLVTDFNEETMVLNPIYNIYLATQDNKEKINIINKGKELWKKWYLIKKSQMI